MLLPWIPKSDPPETFNAHLIINIIHSHILMAPWHFLQPLTEPGLGLALQTSHSLFSYTGFLILIRPNLFLPWSLCISFTFPWKIPSLCTAPHLSLLGLCSNVTCPERYFWTSLNKMLLSLCPNTYIWKWKVKVAQVCLTLRLRGLYSPWNSLGQNTGGGSHSLLQRIFTYIYILYYLTLISSSCLLLSDCKHVCTPSSV